MATATVAPEQLNTRRAAAQHAHAFASSLLYSKDGKFLFQREAHVIRVVNTKNGAVLHECIRSEQPSLPATVGVGVGVGADADAETSEDRALVERVDVSALALHPYNALQLIASYADGKLMVWDFIEEKILQVFDAKAPIIWMGASVASPLMLLLVIAGGSAVENKPQPPPPPPTASPAKTKTKTATHADANQNDTNDSSNTAAITRWSLVEFNMKKKRRGRTLLEQTKTAFTTAAMQSYVNETATTHAGTAGTATTTTEPAFHGDYIVVAASARLFTLKVDRDADGGAGLGRAVAVHKLGHLRDVTCVALHPFTPFEFSIGDSLGQIFRYLRDAAANTKMHWHSHAVGCLAYASDGHALLSGGEENVLVSWQLESGRRAYLPRRSAPLTCIATRTDAFGTGYAVTLQDNVLFQYNPITREEEWHAVGLARSGGQASVSLPWRELVLDPVTHALPLNGVCSAGVLQLYEPYKDRVLSSVLLTERNQVTRTEDEELPQILAEKIAFSPTGSELVTLHRPNTTTDHDATGDEQALRFWQRRENGSFYVHTAIDAPHGTAAVTSLAYSPSSYAYSTDGIVVTGDAQGEFKVWKKTTVVTAAATGTVPGQQQSATPAQITNEVSTTVWHCQSVVKFRNVAISAIQFSRDGSLVAVAYGHLLTLWDLGTMALRGVLTSADGLAIQQVIFPGATSPYLVVKTPSQVQVWNLLTLTLWWRYVVPTEGTFVVAKSDDFMVVLQASTSEYVAMHLTAESPVPVALQRVPFTDTDREIWTVGVHPVNGDLLVVDDVSNVWRVGEQRLDKKALRTAMAQDQENDEMTPLAAMFKQVRSEFQSKRQAEQQRQAMSPNSTAALFDAPAHVLPSMTALYRSFMDKMLPKPQQNDQAAAVVEEDDAAGKKARKKNKKRKKHAAAGTTTGGDDAAKPESEQQQAPSQKRVKAMIEKELALPKQTYSTLLNAFRKNKKTKPAATNA